MTILHELANLGQAIWLDYIRRSFMASGELQKLITMGLRGMTSNPSIFEKAIAGSSDYDLQILELVRQGKDAAEIYEALAITDIQQAADLLRPVYESTAGADGYVSLEVSPNLAQDSLGTFEEAQRLWKAVNRPNLMIKIPATQAGLPAITQAIAIGISVNVTLIFALDRYQAVMEAFLQGLEQRLVAGHRLDGVASVASFFVSRVDSKVDRHLEAIIRSEGANAAQAAALLGKAANANAKLAYQLFREVFSTPRFKRLQEAGAMLQRPLWASTSTKNPAYPDILYVQELIGAHTVNTLPQNTLDAFIDHGSARLTIEEGVEAAQNAIQQLEALGISMPQVTRELEQEGVQAFAEAFDALLASIITKITTERLANFGMRLSLGKSQPPFEAAMQDLSAANIPARIWQHDHTVWRPVADEIRNRLGWLHVVDQMFTHLSQIEALSYAVQAAGYTQAVLLGMGGSSLAPELFARTFPVPEGCLHLQVLDSTDPSAVLTLERSLDLSKTLFIVSTKSGTTEETLSFFRYFYTRCTAQLGADQAGEHFIAITDPDSKLVGLAASYHFRATFLNDPEIGGRYSALSFFGLVPAALAGVDLHRLLANAESMMQACGPLHPAPENPGAVLGAALGALANQGKNKLTLAVSPQIAGFADWVEQLIAESTGKEGRGIVPVAGEPEAMGDVYGEDRVYVSIALVDDASTQQSFAACAKLGRPLIRITLNDIYDLGAQIFLWEFATAVAGWRMDIHPFDQPNVEQAKVIARQMTAAYKTHGSLPQETPALQTSWVTVFSSQTPGTVQEALQAFLALTKPDDYIALQAFVTPKPATTQALQELRLKLREFTHLATTVGYGPRFLHSTGQLHKGDAGQGVFIQFTSDIAEDTPIPDEAGSSQSGMSFGVFLHAQAMGDLQALRNNQRRTIHFHFHGDPAGGMLRLMQAFG
jgi:transaldolase/glucose-6-phosphate isomerase